MNSQIKTFWPHIPYNSYEQFKVSLLHILTCSVPLTWSVFPAALAPLALPCPPSPAVHSRLLPFPPWAKRDDPQNKISSLPALTTPESVYVPVEKCPPPSWPSRDPSQVVHREALQWLLGVCERLVQLQTLTALANHEPWTCLCYIHNKRTVCWAPASAQ